MDVIPMQDQSVSTETQPPRRKKRKDEGDMERVKKTFVTSSLPKADKKKSEGKKLKKKLYEIEEKNENLSKMIYDKNSEIDKLRKSMNSLNEILNSVPIEELRCNSSIASSKLLELSKKNRQLRAELESTKHRLAHKELLLQKKEKEAKTAEEKMHQESMAEGSRKGESPDSHQAKLNSLKQKLFDTRNKNIELTNQLKLAQKCLQQEIGENFNLNTLASHASSSNWRGRAQQILHLQQKVQELKDRLDISMKKGDDYYDRSYRSLDLNVIGNGDSIHNSSSVLSVDRPDVRRSELKHRVKVEALEKEICDLKIQLEDSRNKILALKVRNKTLNDEVVKHKHKAINLEEQTDFNSINVTTLNEKIQQQKENYETKIGELVREIQVLQKKSDGLGVNEEHLLSKVEDLEATIAAKEETINDLGGVIKRLEDDLKAVCGGFLFSCREFRKEEFITILDALESEKNALMEHNKTLNERISSERTKNDGLLEQATKQKIRISRLEAKVRDLEREMEANNEKKKRTQRITEYTSNLSNMGSTTSLMSFTFENSSLLSGRMSEDVVDMASVTELKNRLELADEKITMLKEKLAYVTAEKENDIQTFEQIISNSKNFILQSFKVQRDRLCIEDAY